MIQALKRNAMILTGIVLCGAILVRARPAFITGRGSAGPAALQAESWLWALLALVICLALAAVVAVVVGRLTNAAVGLFVLGAGAFALASRLATVRELAFDGGSLMLVALETALMALLALAASLAMFRFAGPLPDVHPRHGEGREPLLGRSMLMAGGAGVVAIPVIWLLAKSPMMGQALGAVFVGGMVAGLAARMLRPNVQPILVFASPILFGALAHMVVALLTEGALADAYVRRDLPGLSMPMPIHYLAGTLMGVAVGLGWARSFLHHEEEASPAAAR
jgi:hypothetical protein